LASIESQSTRPVGIFAEANPDIKVHTFTQAETHEGMEWVPKLFEDAPSATSSASATSSTGGTF
jgi:hypothetical protein